MGSSEEHRWARLSPAQREMVRDTSRTLLGDITLNRLAAQFTEEEFQLLERAANGEPTSMTERLKLQNKFVTALTAQTDAMRAFFDHLKALGCPADMPSARSVLSEASRFRRICPTCLPSDPGTKPCRVTTSVTLRYDRNRSGMVRIFGRHRTA
jgi:hypothetical protein